MKKERSSFRASGIAIRSIIAAAALAVLVLSAVLIRGGFDAFRQSDITAAGTGYTVRVAFADADGVGGGVFDVVPGEDVSYTVDIPIGSMLEILSGDVETENGRMTLTGVRAPTTVVYRVRRPGVYSLKIINDGTCGTVTPGAGWMEQQIIKWSNMRIIMKNSAFKLAHNQNMRYSMRIIKAR